MFVFFFLSSDVLPFVFYSGSFAMILSGFYAFLESDIKGVVALSVTPEIGFCDLHDLSYLYIIG